MSRKRNKALKRRIAGAYFSSVISITLVLFVVGAAVLLALNTGSFAQYFKENVKITMLLKNGTSDKTAKELQKQVESLEYIKATRYVDQKEGRKELEEMLGADFAGVFSASPVPTSIEVTVKSDYMNSDSLVFVRKKLFSYKQVEQVHCPVEMIQTLSTNVMKLTGIIAIAVLILLLISVALISNTVRLIIFSRRKLISTMKLVGATDSFIVKPYLSTAFLIGLLCSVLACGAAAPIVLKALESGSAFAALLEKQMLIQSAAIVFAAGVGICVISTYYFVIKYTNTDSEELYG